MGRVERIAVVGSRRFEDRAFVRSAMAQAFVKAKASSPDFVQFVIPSEFGRDNVERPCPGVAELVHQILADGRRLGKPVVGPRLLLPFLLRVDWENDSPFSGPAFRWGTRLFDVTTWEGVASPEADVSFAVQPRFLVAIHGSRVDGLAAQAVKCGRLSDAYPEIFEFARR